MTLDSDLQRAALFWGKALECRNPSPTRARWWEDRRIRRRINSIILDGREDGILAKFSVRDDLAFPRKILVCDQLLVEQGVTRYAVAFARKSA